ncbi:CPBP family intramembrane metalloprotease [Candidatus Saccharibacteria bacterium]|nr:CPBP family intramembrane metalloprotease [Candidatus Saccharibacteria bacterium]
MNMVWLLLANVVLFGLIRYISQSKRHKTNKGVVNWDGYDAVSITVAIYLVSQLVAILIYSLYLAATGATSGASELLSSSVSHQFFYILLVEVITLASLQALLKLRGNGLRVLGLGKPNWKDLGYVLVGFGMYLPLLVVSLKAVEVLAPTINLDQQQQIGFENAQGPLQLLLVFCSLVILPPITEEILTRGYLYLGLRKQLPKIWAALITSALFAIAHLQFGNGAPLLWTAAVDTFVLSLVLIYIRNATGKLWAPIGLHMLKNFIAFLALFVFVS